MMTSRQILILFFLLFGSLVVLAVVGGLHRGHEDKRKRDCEAGCFPYQGFSAEGRCFCASPEDHDP